MCWSERTRFAISLIWVSSNRRITWQVDGSLAPRQTEGNCRQIVLFFLQDLDFEWVVPTKDGIFFFFLDLIKTVQGQSHDVNRDVVCQLPPEAGHPQKIVVIFKKFANDMNDATRRRWNIFNKALPGMYPTRVDWCCYALYSSQARKQAWKHWVQGAKARQSGTKDTFTESERSEMEVVFEKKNVASCCLTSSSKKVRGGNQSICGWSLEKTCGNEVEQRVSTRVGGNISKLVQKIWTMSPLQDEFVGHKIVYKAAHWSQSRQGNWCVGGRSQWNETRRKTSTVRFFMHTRVQRVPLGRINWQQSGIQFQCCYTSSRCASMAVSPTVGDMKSTKCRYKTSHNQWNFSIWFITERRDSVLGRIASDLQGMECRMEVRSIVKVRRLGRQWFFTTVME